VAGARIRGAARHRARSEPPRRSVRATPRPVGRGSRVPGRGRDPGGPVAGREREGRTRLPRRGAPGPARRRRGGTCAGIDRAAARDEAGSRRWLGSSWRRTSSRSATWWASSSPTPVTT
jgi:hypothetical protein